MLGPAHPTVARRRTALIPWTAALVRCLGLRLRCASARCTRGRRALCMAGLLPRPLLLCAGAAGHRHRPLRPHAGVGAAYGCAGASLHPASLHAMEYYLMAGILPPTLRSRFCVVGSTRQNSVRTNESTRRRRGAAGGGLKSPFAGQNRESSGFHSHCHSVTTLASSQLDL